MRQKILTYATGVSVALLFVCGMTFAKSSNVNLIYRAQLGNNLVLAAGKYHVVVNKKSQTPDVAFYQNGKLVGKTPVKIVSEAKKNNQTEVFYNSPHNNVRHISQIDFSGWHSKLMFKGSHHLTAAE
ncbi:MAG: hypothetical protein ACRD2B_18770 [Terriglobia bacterium]